MAQRALTALPNLLSLSRFALAGGFVVAADAPTRAVLIAVAAATDFLDGWLARRRQQASRWGALLDPIADRTFVVVVIAVFLVEERLTLGQVAVLLLRDVATVIGYLVVRFVPRFRRMPVQARRPGKIVTVLQLTTLFAVLLVPQWVQGLVVAVGVISVWAIVDYLAALWRAGARS